MSPPKAFVDIFIVQISLCFLLKYISNMLLLFHSGYFELNSDTDASFYKFRIDSSLVVFQILSVVAPTSYTVDV